MKSVTVPNLNQPRSSSNDAGAVGAGNRPLTPSYTAPRSPPQPVKQPRHRVGRGLLLVDDPYNFSFKSSIKSVFRNRKRSPSPSHSTATSSSDTNSMAPLPVVSSHSHQDDGGECPVCLEPLSFSFRLPGEKPHIVPECGHALHEVRLFFRLLLSPYLFYPLKACFTAVYGPPPGRTLPQKSNLGVCGVCRRPMKLTDGDGGKSNSASSIFFSSPLVIFVPELAALTGMGDSHSSPLFPGRDTPVGRNRAVPKPQHPNDDDPLESVSSKTAQSDHGSYVVAPSIQVRPEFSSLTRTTAPNQPLTCIVVIELPGRRVPGNVPGPVIPENYGKPRSLHSGSGHSSPQPDFIPGQRKTHGLDESFLQRQPSDTQHNSTSNGHLSHDYAQTTLIHSEEDSPFHAITEDLRSRIIDWKGHPLSDLGPLQMYDLLSVRRDSAIREFYVYLFKEAIICVVEEKKRGLSLTSQTTSSKGVLRLKGRIYVRHIKKVIASSAAGEMSLTIDMEDELASFILIFKDRASLESWKNNIQALVNMYQSQTGSVRHQEPERPPDLETFGGSQKAMRMLSGTSHTTVSTVDSLLQSSSQSTTSSSTSPGSLMARQNRLAPLGEDDELSNYDDSASSLVTPHTSSGPSNSLSPLPHPQMDLLLVISLPPPNSLPSTAQLKFRVIKATLDFLVASLGPKDRLSVVTFEVGVGGNVRKTPFLMVGRPNSRTRLEKFISDTGVKLEENKDEFLVRGSKEEKTDVVTAVNHGKRS